MSEIPRDYIPPVPPHADEEIVELRFYAALLAQIMSGATPAEVAQNAVHCWRVELDIEQHRRLERHHLGPDGSD